MSTVGGVTDPVFAAKVRLATGMLLEDAVVLGEAQEKLRQERIRVAGYCCEAGLTCSPDPCPWHNEPTP